MRPRTCIEPASVATTTSIAAAGLSQRADKKRIYVVRANGEVVANTGAGWFQRDAGSEIRPGDSIVVPLDVDQPLARWGAITQIIYNLAIAAAAVNSFTRRETVDNVAIAPPH